MAIIQSHALLAEKIAKYSANPDKKHIQRTKSKENINGNQLSELVSSVCSRILSDNPQIVAQTTTGQISESVLHDLIIQYAEEQSIRAGYYRQQIKKQVFDSLFGYGPLQFLIDDPDISDIDAISPYDITIKKHGIRSRVSINFDSANSYEIFCRLIIIRQGGLINENDSHCRVTDFKNRLRINVTVPPRSLNFSCLSIRKHSVKSPTIKDLQKTGMFSLDLIPVLEALAKTDKSILICGRGGSGKTTLLRAIINSMDPLERILIAESDSEIYPEKSCCLCHRIKQKNEGGKPVSLRDLIRDGLTMSLDTYCIGEIVGDEAYEFIRAAYSGHRCLATVHAVSAEEALDRVVSLARGCTVSEPNEILRNMLAKSLDIVIFLNDFAIQRVIEVTNYVKESGLYEHSIIW